MPSTSPSRRVARAAAIAVAVLAVAVLAAGCGTVRDVGARRGFGIVLTEYRIAPDAIRIRAGVLTITVHNIGRRTHNLVVTARGVPDARPLAATKPLWPGQRQKLTVLLTPGTYTIASTVLNDQALGEYGSIEVG